MADPPGVPSSRNSLFARSSGGSTTFKLKVTRQQPRGRTTLLIQYSTVLMVYCNPILVCTERYALEGSCSARSSARGSRLSPDELPDSTQRIERIRSVQHGSGVRQLAASAAERCPLHARSWKRKQLAQAVVHSCHSLRRHGGG